jgi:hypothetical protein
MYENEARTDYAHDFAALLIFSNAPPLWLPVDYHFSSIGQWFNPLSAGKFLILGFLSAGG